MVLVEAIDDFEQGGHCTWVVRKEGHLVARLDLEVDVLEELGALHCLAQAVYLEHLVAHLAFGSEDDARIAACRWLDLLDVEFLEHLLATGGLLRLGNVGREAADELQELLLLLFGLLVGHLLLLQGELRRLVPEAVVAGKERTLLEVDIHGVGAHRVEEVAVVAHYEHRVLKALQVVLEPHHGVEVKVVGGLVEQQVVGVAEQRLCQHHAHLLLCRNVAHHHVVEFLLDAKARKQGCGIRLGIPAVHLGKLLFEFGGTHAVLLGHLGLFVDGILLLHDVVEHGVAAQHGVEYRVLVILVVILLQHAQALAGSHLVGAACRVKFAAQDTQEG